MEIEREHIIDILRKATNALKSGDSIALKELSNQTLHCATCVQDSGSITIAIMNYALGKMIERNQHMRVKNWPAFVKKLSLFYSIAARELEKNNIDDYERSIIEARKSLTGISDIKNAIKEVLTKAAINKASRLYEHGLSLGKTANLLGVTQWDISEYAGQRIQMSPSASGKLNAKKRAEMAMEFFK